MKNILGKKSVKMGILVIILAIAMTAIGINVQNSRKLQKFHSHLAAAERYLLELDYEQAIVEYSRALEIEPRSEEVLAGLENTYLAYAQSMADAGDYANAIAILQEGYELTGRENLRSRMEELQRVMEEEARKDEIRRTVESEEFRDKVNKIPARYSISWFNPLSDAQIAELSRPVLDILVEYQRYFEDGYYRQWLPKFYYNCGEYELCKEVYKETGERVIDLVHDEYSNHIELDEYGRTILDRCSGARNDHESQYEYGENGKLTKDIVVGTESFDDGRRIVYTNTTIFEYDSEGRLIKKTDSLHREDSQNGSSDEETISTYIYNEKGYAKLDTYELYENGQLYIVEKRTTDYIIIDEYGSCEQDGEPYDVYRETFD